MRQHSQGGAPFQELRPTLPSLHANCCHASSAGIVLLLDGSLLAAVHYTSIRALLQQLHKVKGLMPVEARVQAYTARECLRGPAAQHLGNQLEHDAYLQQLTGENPELCGLLEDVATVDQRSCLDHDVEPSGTFMLRNAQRVSHGALLPEFAAAGVVA
jgi:hypothetical protein